MKNSHKKGKKYSVNFVSEVRTVSSVAHRVRDLTAFATLVNIKQSIVEEGLEMSANGLHRIRWRRVAVARVNRGSLGVGLYR